MIWLPFVLRWGDANAYSIRRLTLKTCIPEIKMSYVFRETTQKLFPKIMIIDDNKVCGPFFDTTYI